MKVQLYLGMVSLWLVLTGFCAHAFQTSTPLTLPSDSLTVQSWTIADGLPVNTVNNLIQDHKGFLWASTYDGLIRFDGELFKIYDHANTPLMPHNRTTYLHIDNYGGKWVALEYGGVFYMNETDTLHYDADNGFTTGQIIQIKEYANGYLFFNTNRGLYSFIDGSFTLVFEGSSVLQRQIRDFIYEDDGVIWLATRDGLIKLDTRQDTKTVYNLEDSSLKNDLYVVHRTKSGELLVGTRNGIYLLNDESLQEASPYQNMQNSLVPNIYEDDQVLMFSTDRGIYRMDNGVAQLLEGSRELNNIFAKFYRDSRDTLWMVGRKGVLATLQEQRIRAFSGINYFVNDIYEDMENNIWVATQQGGLMMLRRSLVQTIGEPEGLSGDNILAIYKDSGNRYWISARSNWLNKIENGTITQFPKSDFSSNTVLSSAEDQNGNMLFGTLRLGLYRLEDDQLVNYQLSNDFDRNTVHAIFPSGTDSLWIGTYNGLLLLNTDLELIGEYTTENGLSGNKIRYITKDPAGTLWVGTMSNGINAFKDGTFVNYNVDNGLSSNNIRSIYVDEDNPNTLWVGTENNGLNRIRDGQIDFITVEDGLPDHNIHWISQDSNGWLWILTNKGILQIQKSELNAYLDGNADDFRYRLYGEHEGMRNPEGNGAFQEAGIRDDDDRFWFATQEGVAIIKAGNRGQKDYEPYVVIREVLADNKFFYGDSLRFDPTVNDLQVYFSGISFTYPENTRFRYKIEELHSSWISNGKQNQLLLNNLSPATYTLIIQASNVSGGWSPNTASLSFTITPRFYQLWWFYLIVLSGVAGLIYLVTNIRYKRLILKQEKLEAVIYEQTREIRKEKEEIEKQHKVIESQAEDLRQSNASKDKFFSIIAHDLRNPFQAMLAYSDFLKDDFKQMSDDELKSSIDKIGTASRSLYDLVENLLVWASIQTGKKSMNPEIFQLEALLKKNIDLFRQSCEQKQIKLTADIQDQIKIKADRNMIDTVVRNLISNAIKFTPEEGRIDVKAYIDNDSCVFQVKDSGIGMSQNMKNKILDSGSDSTRLGTNNEKGTGLGLVLCKEMVQDHSGSLQIDSTEGKGSIFTIHLPLNLPDSALSES